MLLTLVCQRDTRRCAAALSRPVTGCLAPPPVLGQLEALQTAHWWQEVLEQRQFVQVHVTMFADRRIMSYQGDASELHQDAAFVA